MNAQAQTLLWFAQRASAAVLAFAVVVHLATMVYAVRGDLSAGEIITRVQSNAMWPAFYMVFVFAAAIHAPIGLRTVLRETTTLRGAVLNGLCLAIAIAIAGLGIRAVIGLSRAMP